MKTKRAKKTKKVVKRQSLKILLIIVLVASVGFLTKHAPDSPKMEKGVQVVANSVIRPAQAIQEVKTVYVVATGTIKIYSTDEAKKVSANILKNRGWSDHNISRFKCLMQHENASFNQFAMNVNTPKSGKISVDDGVMQWNNKTAPIFIDDVCKHSIECSVTKFAEYVESNKNGWNRWFGYVNNCK